MSWPPALRVGDVPPPFYSLVVRDGNGTIRGTNLGVGRKVRAKARGNSVTGWSHPPPRYSLYRKGGVQGRLYNRGKVKEDDWMDGSRGEIDRLRFQSCLRLPGGPANGLVLKAGRFYT